MIMNKLTKKFLSTPLERGETVFTTAPYPHTYVSIHSPRARGDTTFPNAAYWMVGFYPLPSSEGRLVGVIAVFPVA